MPATPHELRRQLNVRIEERTLQEIKQLSRLWAPGGFTELPYWQTITISVRCCLWLRHHNPELLRRAYMELSEI